MTKRIPALLRKTAPLQASVARAEARLDHPSHLAIAYARRWLKDGPAATGVDYLASGIVRRALAVYMAHLDAAGEPLREAKAVHACCASMPIDRDAQEDAWRRLEAIKTDEPMPTYQDVLRGPGWVERVAAMVSQAEAYAEAGH